MTKPHYRQATLADVLYVAERLREDDLAELRAQTDHPPGEVLSLPLAEGWPLSVGISKQGNPTVLWGHIPDREGDSAIVWMVSTAEIAENVIPFLRMSAEIIEDLNQQYPVLHNVIDARNTKHIEWLTWLGFAFIKVIPGFGIQGEPFYEFVRIPQRKF
jgi:hypothetical protein